MKLRVEDYDNWQICFISGSSSATEKDRFNESLVETLSNCNKDLIINMRDLEFIDSSGIASLVLGKKVLAKNGYRLSLTNIPEPIRNIFEITFLDRLIPMYDDMSEVIGTSSESA